MRDKALYRRILGIQTPWEMPGIEPDLKADELVICSASTTA